MPMKNQQMWMDLVFITAHIHAHTYICQIPIGMSFILGDAVSAIGNCPTQQQVVHFGVPCSAAIEN